MGMIDKEGAKRAICEACYMYKYIGDSYTECKYYPCDDIKALEAISEAPKERVISAEKLNRMKFVAIKGDKTEEAYRTGWNGAIDCVIGEYASAEAEQVTGKLKKPCDSLLKTDSDECKEQKSKLESADATCATCADRALCIMSDDGGWKACKDYRPSDDAEVYENYEHATLVDIKEPLNASAKVAPKIDHDRDWIIGCIQHDGFIHTHRFDKANQIILDALSAEAVQGEWIRKEKEINDCDGHRAFYWYECDQCGSRPPRNEFTKQEWLSNYCPNCGARMKGGDTDETD